MSMYALSSPDGARTHTQMDPNHNGGTEHEYALTLQVHAAIIQRE